MFPFDCDQNLAVIACKCVFNDDKPILRVSRDEDGDWQFLCGASHSASDAMLVSIGQVYEKDASIGEISGLSANQTAIRDSLENAWKLEVQD